jgi:hypothetical protein
MSGSLSLRFEVPASIGTVAPCLARKNSNGGEWRGWQSALALHLGIDRTQIWRYVSNNTVPGPVDAAVTCWLKNGAPK